MSKLQHGSHEELEAIRLKATSHFAPIFLQCALLRLGRASGGGDSLEQFEKTMLETLERACLDDPDFEDMKEFGAEFLHICIRQVKSASDMEYVHEDLHLRRTPGRSEKPETLEDQLQKGLEDSFPASDPPAVVSTTISGRSKKLTGTDEVLARQRQEREKEKVK